jgi:hypothetical protein
MALRLKDATKAGYEIRLTYGLVSPNSSSQETYLELPLVLTLTHGQPVEIAMSFILKDKTPEEAFARLETWLRRAADAVRDGRTNLVSLPL